MERADEAAGICAKLLAAEATRAVSNPAEAIKRGKLADIYRRTPSRLVRIFERLSGKPPRQHSRLLRGISYDSSVIYYSLTLEKGAAKVTRRLPHEH